MRSAGSLLRRLTVSTLTLGGLTFGGLTLGCVRDHRTVLTVYSPHGPDLLGYFETEFEKAYPSIDVQWVDMGSQEIVDRVRGEGVNPQADVWFGAPAESFERVAREHLLEPYRPTW